MYAINHLESISQKYFSPTIALQYFLNYSFLDNFMIKGNRLRLLCIAILLITGTEFYARYYWGFGDNVLYREDRCFEYIPLANQNRFIFRNHIRYNNFSMRSDTINKKAIKILGFGDSVINGGTLTDNDTLATSLLCTDLSAYFDTSIQVLNISASGWGPDNCYAYLQNFGNFGGKLIILFVSSHDAYDDMDFQKVVGVNNHYPDNQYPLALFEVFDRYLTPRIIDFFSTSHTDNSYVEIKKNEKVFNNGFQSFYDYSQKFHIPLLIYLHAEQGEVRANCYNQQGRQIINFAQEHNIKLIRELDSPLFSSDYRDYIHPNDSGQKKIELLILNFLKENYQSIL